jgi:hypothetical protein
MRWIKKFENYNTSDYNGLTEEYIEELFYELKDDILNISVSFTNSIVIIGTDENRSKFGSIPYIEVLISNILEVNRLYNSDDFKEIISVSNDRLGDYDCYISDYIIDDRVNRQNTQAFKENIIKVFIHRKIDEKYL